MHILITVFVFFLSVAPAFGGGEQTGILSTPGADHDLGITVYNGRLSFDVRDADVSIVVAEISKKTGIPVVMGEGVGHRVTARVVNLSLEETMRILFGSTAFVYELLPETKSYRVVRAGTFSGNGGGNGTMETVTAPPGLEKRFPDHGASSPGYHPRVSRFPRNGDTPLDSSGRPLYQKGELLVRFKTNIPKTLSMDIHRSLGSTVLHTLVHAGIEQVRIRPGWTEQMAMDAYEASGLVVYAERHALRYPSDTIPDDPDYSGQWWLGTTRIPKAWAISRGSDHLVIAVIDTGVDILHPDLAANIWINIGEIDGNGIDDDGNGYIDDIHGWDFTGGTGGGDDDPMDTDDKGHGTHVAGIIAAVGNNNVGMAGINWSADLMALKVQADGSRTMLEVDIIEAIDYAIRMGARIVNCSFGGGSFSQAEYDAFQRLRDSDIIAVCAAGNGNGTDGKNTDHTQHFPSGYDVANIISVAAGDVSDELAPYSNFGLDSVDVMAPGSDIRSTIPFLLAESPTEAFVATADQVISANGMTHAGRTDENGITGRIYNCGDGNDPDDFPPDISGYIALIARDGIFTFASKAGNAQDAGAAAVVISNHLFPDFLGTLDDTRDWVPVVSVSKANGSLLAVEAAMDGRTVTVIDKTIPAYGPMSGTSMAAPHVSGIAGLLLSLDADMSYQMVKSTILETVDEFPELLGLMTTGGRVNALKALCRVSAVAADLSGDNQTDLSDLVLSLQTLTFPPSGSLSPCVAHGVDVNGDHRFGMEETVYLLHRLSGMR